MRKTHFILLGTALLAVAIPSFAGSASNAASIAKLETQIQSMVKGTSKNKTHEADKRRLNELKIELMSLLKTSVKSEQAEITSLNDSLGSWSTGLPKPGASASGAEKKTAAAGAESPCPNRNTDLAITVVPMLDPIEEGSKTITGVANLPHGSKGSVQVCVDKKPAGSPRQVKSGKFTVPVAQALKRGQKVVAQVVEKNAYGPFSVTLEVGSCRETPNSGLDKPTFSRSISKGEASYSVALPNLPKKNGQAQVRICANRFPIGKPVTVTTKGADVTALASKAIPGEVAVAQQVANKTYGPLSDPLTIGKCSETPWNGNPRKLTPMLQPLADKGTLVSGSVPGQRSGNVRICVGDYEAAIAPIENGGTFVATVKNPNQQNITAQLITSPEGTLPRTYGPPSKVIKPGHLYSDKFTASFVGGVEQGGFSSRASSSRGFLNAFFQTPFYGKSSWVVSPAVWARINLLSGPLPSTTNVLAALTDASGTTITSNLSKVGQVVDYSFGPMLRFWQGDSPDGTAERLSFFADVGAITPLSSTNIQYSLKAPPNNSQQCLQLVDQYWKYLANGSTPPACTLQSAATGQGISTLSFAPIDRTNFLFRYNFGLRFTHFYPAQGNQAPYAGSVDFSIGQDEAITGGSLGDPVFRVEAIYPLTLGASPYLYLFGQASMKFGGNMYSNPIILATAQTPSLPLAPDVAVLPLTQPDRDFYQFGVGFNITAIFCKFKAGSCGTPAPAAASK